jgi:hypothetical protein
MRDGPGTIALTIGGSNWTGPEIAGMAKPIQAGAA